MCEIPCFAAVCKGVFVTVFTIYLCVGETVGTILESFHVCLFEDMYYICVCVCACVRVNTTGLSLGWGCIHLGI